MLTYVNAGIWKMRYTEFKYKMFRLELKLEVPSHTTAAAIEEGWKLKEDSSAPRYSTMESLKDAREV